MRIDLPLCGLDSCRYSFDGNCTSKSRYKSCEFAYFKELEADGRLIELPCKVGDTVYIMYEDCNYIGDCRGMKCEDCIYAIPRFCPAEVDSIQYAIYIMDLIGKRVFLTKEEAEAKLAELKGE